MMKFGATAVEARTFRSPRREKPLQNYGEQSNEGSPVLWSRSPRKVSPECPYRGDPKPDSRRRDREDLYNIYQKMNNACDLTLRDLCTHVATNMPREEHSPNDVPSVVDSVDFGKGLAAVQSTVTTQQTSTKREKESELPPESMITRALSLKDHFHLENSKPNGTSVANRSGLRRNYSVGNRKGQHLRVETPVGSAKEAGNERTSLDESKVPNTNTMAKQSGGAPHSNFCCICNKLLVFFKTRCLVCGKCYCSHCVKQGMGSMPEGRKCKSCRGSRFSRRYIEKAGKAWFRMTNGVKMAEIKWAKKGCRKEKP